MAAHEALTPDEQAYIDESQEVDRVDPMLKVEQFIDGQFRDLEAGRATQKEIKTRIFDFLSMQRTVLKMLRETDKNR